MAETVAIARCPIHGLHGARDRCYECDRVCDQVPMVDASDAEDAQALLAEAREVITRIISSPHHSHPGQPAVSYLHRRPQDHERAMALLRRLREAEPKAEPDKQSQRLILEFTRLRQAYAEAVNRKEEAGTDATYQRGLVAGLQAAIGKVEEVSS